MLLRIISFGHMNSLLLPLRPFTSVCLIMSDFSEKHLHSLLMEMKRMSLLLTVKNTVSEEPFVTTSLTSMPLLYATSLSYVSAAI